MIIETNLEKIKEAAEKKCDENWHFRSFLKGRDKKIDISIEELNFIVYELFERVSIKIDCTACGNCCRELSPTLKQDDIKRLSQGLEISSEEFTARFLVEKEENLSDKFIFRQKPCPFLKGNLCSHYELRPKECKSFPHFHKKDFVFSLIRVIQNYAICPIVFNVYEALKKKLW